MLGPPKPRRLEEPIAVSLEALIPPDHFYRHLEATLDLGFVRDWTRGRYAERGRPSVDPVVFFKLQLVMFFEGIRSERQLIAMASLNLAHRWQLGYALDEELPDHSSLTRIRQRLGVDVFPRFFEQIVDRCQKAGLVWGRERSVDATKVEANADLDSLIPRFAHQAKTHLAQLFADNDSALPDETELEGSPDNLPAGGVRLPGALAPQGSPLATPRWQLLEERRLDPQRPPSGSYRRTTDFREASLDKVRGYHGTAAYQKAMRKRQVWVEPLFAEAKAWHGLRRLRLRGLRNANIQGLLIAAGQNLKRLLSWRGWRRRPFPVGAAGLILPALPCPHSIAP